MLEIPDSTVNRIVDKFSQNGIDAKMGDFTPQLYNIWNFAGWLCMVGGVVYNTCITLNRFNA